MAKFKVYSDGHPHHKFGVGKTEDEAFLDYIKQNKISPLVFKDAKTLKGSPRNR